MLRIPGRTSGGVRLRVVAASLFTGWLLGATPSPAHAAAWLAPTNLEVAGANTAVPDVAIDAAGTTTAVWVRSDGKSDRIWASTRPVGGPWQNPVAISGAAADAAEPQVTIDAAGTALAVWRRFDGTTQRIEAATRPAGGAWQTAAILSDAGRAAYGPQVAVDPSGTATVIWFRSDGTADRIQASTRAAGGTWLAPVTISSPSDATGDADAQQLAVDAAGNVMAVWQRYDRTTYNSSIVAARRPAGGTWQASTTLSDTTQDAHLPQVAIDATGTATAVWHSFDGTSTRIQAATRAAAGTWQTPAYLNEAGQHGYGPKVALDAAGNATAVWARSDNGESSALAATRPAGGSWQSAVTISGPGPDLYNPQLGVDPAGDATGVWERSDGTSSTVESNRRSAGGAWQTPVRISAAGDNANAPRLATDSAGDGVAVWQRASGSDYVTQAAILDATAPTLGTVSVPAQARAGLPVTVTAAAADLWSAIAGSSWSFGDDGSAAGATASHTYAKAGTYTVTFTVTDAAGNTSTASRAIAVSAAPVIPAPPLIVRGRVATFHATLARAPGAKTCPKAKALKITLRGAKPLVIKARKLKVTKTTAGCLLTRTLTLKKPVKAGTKVTAKITGKGLKRSTLSAVAG